MSVFSYLPDLNHFLTDFDTLYQEWSAHKRSTPSYGGILLSPDYKHVSRSWLLCEWTERDKVPMTLAKPCWLVLESTSAWHWHELFKCWFRVSTEFWQSEKHWHFERPFLKILVFVCKQKWKKSVENGLSGSQKYGTF